MEDSIVSPPYPGIVTSSQRLYRQLAELRSWLVAEQSALRNLVPEKADGQLKEPDNLADESVWEQISIIDKYTVLMYMRRIRESWDLIIREHEDAFESRLALKKQFSVLLMAHYVLQEAFVTPELRELRQERAVNQAQHEMAALQKALRDIVVPQEMTEPNEPEDTDDWFGDEVET